MKKKSKPKSWKLKKKKKKHDSTKTFAQASYEDLPTQMPYKDYQYQGSGFSYLEFEQPKVIPSNTACVISCIIAFIGGIMWVMFQKIIGWQGVGWAVVSLIVSFFIGFGTMRYLPKHVQKLL